MRGRGEREGKGEEGVEGEGGAPRVRTVVVPKSDPHYRETKQRGWGDLIFTSF